VHDSLAGAARVREGNFADVFMGGYFGPRKSWPVMQFNTPFGRISLSSSTSRKVVHGVKGDGVGTVLPLMISG
jgi:hypothetical protein